MSETVISAQTNGTGSAGRAVLGAPDPASHDGSSFGRSGDLNPRELNQVARWEVEAGRLTLEEANKKLSADGGTPIELEKNPHVLEMDKAFPPAKPEEFQIQYQYGQEFTPEFQKSDLQLRNALSAARFTAGIGASLAEESYKTADKFKTMTESEQILWQQSERVALENMWGSKFVDKLRDAGQLILELDAKFPGFADYINENGIGSSAFVIAQFAQQAERMRDRQESDVPSNMDHKEGSPWKKNKGSYLRASQLLSQST